MSNYHHHYCVCVVVTLLVVVFAVTVVICVKHHHKLTISEVYTIGDYHLQYVLLTDVITMMIKMKELQTQYHLQLIFH